ncbi:PIR protein [Plasmodium vivax]|uniref:VIR protein n=1 Tax=Plasmodium vivax TaxID=5855 RepID=A0A564ZZZ8_PLAVI|nr:PIR protein [Plasmodium vivax]
MATTEWDQTFSDLPAYKKYGEFNLYDINDRDGICEKFGVTEDKANKFCKRAVNILKDLNNIDDEDRRNDRCVYFQHWFSDQVRRYYSNNDKYFSNYELSNNLFDAINYFNYNKMRGEKYRCYASRNAESVKIEKDLHDYFRNVDFINCKGKDYAACEIVYNYVNYINDLYKKRQENNLCCYLANGDVEPECSHYFSCDKKYNPKNILAELEKQMNLIRTGQSNHIIVDERVNAYNTEDGYRSSSNYGLSVFKQFKPQDFYTLNESLLRSRRLHNGLILTGMIGVFLGLILYIRSHSAKLWKKKRRAENLRSYMSDVSSNYSSATSETGSEYTPSNSGESSMYLSYQSSQSSL